MALAELASSCVSLLILTGCDSRSFSVLGGGGSAASAAHSGRPASSSTAAVTRQALTVWALRAAGYPATAARAGVAPEAKAAAWPPAGLEVGQARLAGWAAVSGLPAPGPHWQRDRTWSRVQTAPGPGRSRAGSSAPPAHRRQLGRDRRPASAR